MGAFPTVSAEPAGDAASERAALAELCHEIGNALTPAIGYAEALARRSSHWPDERDRRAVHAIGASLRRLTRLVRAPDCAPDGPQEPRSGAPSCLRAALDEALSQVPPDRLADLSIHWDAAVSDGERTDAPVVCQVVANLLDNAAKYSAPGTPISVYVRATGDSVQIAVRDRGIGFGPADAEAIFLGQRTHAARAAAHGSGIGLPLCRRLAESLGGRLTAAAAAGGGSEFCLQLPIARPALCDVAGAAPHPLRSN